jgi:DNA-binding SARP family transcriptional activator
MSPGEGGEPAPLRAQLLGAPQLCVQGRDALPLERHDAALLALLAIEGAMPRARAAALLWADAPAERARTNLRQRLFKLRRASPQHEVIADGTLLGLAATLRHDLGPLAPRLREDPAACAGELLGELDYSRCPGLADWVAAARSQWRNRRIQALAEIAATLEVEQRIAQALPYAERLVADDPTLEHGHRRLMRLHYLRGDRAAALAAYDRCHELLRLELGTVPGAETQALRRLIEASGAAPASSSVKPIPAGIQRPPTLVGREAEWADLDRAVGDRGIVLVLGEAGAGKTRLTADWAAHHGALHVGARPGDAEVPFALLRRLVRALAGDLQQPAGELALGQLAQLLSEPGSARAVPLNERLLGQDVASMIDRASSRLHAAVLDDLHFADDASLALLLPVLLGADERQTENRSAWILASRPDELPPTLAALRDAHPARPGLQVFFVNPLSAQGVHAMLDSMMLDGLDAAKLATPLYRHTGGNPLFMLETLRLHIAATGRAPSGEDLREPQTVGTLIERRLARLSRQAQKLARAAAVAGQDWSPKLAEHVMRRDALELADAWAELERAQVVRGNAFAHDLVQAAALRTVPAAIAELLHERVAEYLEAHGGEPARVAAHWEATSRALPAALACARAAADARRASQRLAEAGWLARAAAHFERAGHHAEAFRVRFERIDALRPVAHHRQVRAEAESLLARAADDAGRALALEALASLANDAFEFAGGLEHLRALRALPAGAVAPERAMTLARLEATALAQSGHQTAAFACLAPFVTSARRDPAAAGHAALLADHAVLLIAVERHREARESLIDAERGARANDDAATLYTVLCNLAWCRYCLGELRRSTEHYEEARRVHVRMGGDLPPQSKHDMGLARQYRELGRFDQALALVDRTVDEQRAAGNLAVLTMSTCERANLLLRLGQGARGAAGIEDAPPGAAGSVRAVPLVTRARIARYAGRPRHADLRADLERALDLVQTEGRPYYRLMVQMEVGRTLEPQAAVTRLTHVLDEGLRIDLPAVAMPARAALIEMLVHSGAAAEAATHAQALVDEFEHGLEPVNGYAPEYWWNAARAFDLAGDVPAALRALAHAQAWILEQALPHVPDEFRPSFLARNPVNASVLRAAQARLPSRLRPGAPPTCTTAEAP